MAFASMFETWLKALKPLAAERLRASLNYDLDRENRLHSKPGKFVSWQTTVLQIPAEKQSGRDELLPVNDP
jgi:hypothetical protein